MPTYQGFFGRRVFGIFQVKQFPRINSKARASEPLDAAMVPLTQGLW